MPNHDSPFRASLAMAFEHAIAHLESLEGSSVTASTSLETLRSRLGKGLAAEGAPPEQVVADLLRDVDGGIIGSAGGRFYAWVVGGLLPAALAADWLSSAWDQNAGIHVSGPAAAVVEEVAGAWIKDILGLPAGASFAFVTGCQMAHATCLAAARNAVLARHGWDVERQGLFGAPAIRLLMSEERHGSVDRAVRLLGMGLNQIHRLPADEEGGLRPDALEQALAGSDGPTIVLLMAGDLNRGAYDSFETLIPIARRYGAWVHVDGAFGLWAAASPRLRYLVKGVGN
ncbi:MAG TPA: aminotransferase class V-fold PLP-dependent enzyme, partial [Bryobacteraceae bacterium]